MSAPEAFQLLTLPNATLSTHTTIQTGVVALECITIVVPPSGVDARSAGSTDRDVYLVLRLNSYEIPLDPTKSVEFSVDSNGVRTYRFLGTETDPSVLVLSIVPQDNLEDIETLEGIFTQYAAEVRGGKYPVAGPAATISGGGAAHGDLRGHLVLINEDNGEVVGQVDRKFNIREDPRLHDRGKEDQPVVIEVPESDDDDDEGTPLEAFVRYVPPGEGDWITKGATVVSHAISATTNLLVTTITSASTQYIAHSRPATPTPSGSSASPNTPSPLSTRPPSDQPSPQPSKAVVFLTSEKTRKGLSAVHAMSGQAVQVSSKTVTMVDGMIRKAMGGKPKEATKSSSWLASTPGGKVKSRSPSPVPLPGYSERPPLPPRGNHSPFPSQSSLSVPSPSGRSSPAPPSPPPRKLGTKARVLLSADLILSTIDHSAKQILDVSSESLGAVIGHKYGPEASQTSNHVTGTARNVALVYIDMRGIGRKALLKRAGKEFVKARVSSSNETRK